MASSVISHSGQLPAASMMARVDLEEMRNGGSARSSTSPSIALSSSSPGSTPRRWGSCRPAEELLQETKAKGSLVDRVAFLENRVLKMEEERISMEMTASSEKRNKKGIKSLVKSCVRGKLNTKD